MARSLILIALLLASSSAGPVTPSPKSCGVFDFTKFICCDGRLHLQVWGLLNGACCGSSYYSTALSQCCNGTVTGRPGGLLNAACCNKIGFDKRFSLCCNGGVFAKGLHNQCCGKGIFNPNVQVCCQEKSVPKAIQDREPLCQ